VTAARPSARPPVRLGVLTISDLGAQGRREDTSGDAIVAWAVRREYDLVVRSIVPDETNLIASKLSRWADSGEVDLVLTTGGTGLAPRDVTPEATLSILERQAAGIVEALRAAIGPRFPQAWLSRATAGTRGKTLIVNLAGSEKAVTEGLEVLEAFIDHAVDQVIGTHTVHEPSAVSRRPIADG
jgi:molybdopterin adenylyltransferase